MLINIIISIYIIEYIVQQRGKLVGYHIFSSIQYGFGTPILYSTLLYFTRQIVLYNQTTLCIYQLRSYNAHHTVAEIISQLYICLYSPCHIVLYLPEYIYSYYTSKYNNVITVHVNLCMYVTQSVHVMSVTVLHIYHISTVHLYCQYLHN